MLADNVLGFHICPRSFASRPNIHLSAADIISRHTSRPKESIYVMFKKKKRSVSSSLLRSRCLGCHAMLPPKKGGALRDIPKKRLRRRLCFIGFLNNHEAQPSGFTPAKTRAASFLSGFKNIPQKACVLEV